jgi:predicted DNA-binding transcriptional regulator YafY
MTAQQLADAPEVSVRTIYRDIESLGAAGVPVYGEAGHEGGYRLLEGYRTRLTGLTVGEAESLFLTGLPTVARTQKSTSRANFGKITETVEALTFIYRRRSPIATTPPGS